MVSMQELWADAGGEARAAGREHGAGGADGVAAGRERVRAGSPDETAQRLVTGRQPGATVTRPGKAIGLGSQMGTGAGRVSPGRRRAEPGTFGLFR
jgi:hypothetical protein